MSAKKKSVYSIIQLHDGLPLSSNEKRESKKYSLGYFKDWMTSAEQGQRRKMVKINVYSNCSFERLFFCSSPAFYVCPDMKHPSSECYQNPSLHGTRFFNRDKKCAVNRSQISDWPGSRRPSTPLFVFLELLL